MTGIPLPCRMAVYHKLYRRDAHSIFVCFPPCLTYPLSQHAANLILMLTLALLDLCPSLFQWLSFLMCLLRILRHVKKRRSIVAAATVATDPSYGQVLILVVKDGLWFGNKLAHSIINPDQLRYAGIKAMNNNPFGSNTSPFVQKLYRFPPDILHYISLETTTPTQLTLRIPSHIHLTMDTILNPHNAQLAPSESAETETDGFGRKETGHGRYCGLFTVCAR